MNWAFLSKYSIDMSFQTVSYGKMVKFTWYKLMTTIDIAVTSSFIVISVRPPLWTFNKESYIKLAESYREDTNFREFCEIFHPKLLEFLVESMWVYAQHKLS